MDGAVRGKFNVGLSTPSGRKQRHQEYGTTGRRSGTTPKGRTHVLNRRSKELQEKTESGTPRFWFRSEGCVSVGTGVSTEVARPVLQDREPRPEGLNELKSVVMSGKVEVGVAGRGSGVVSTQCPGRSRYSQPGSQEGLLGSESL